ncbi:acyl-CoA carboxylase epsilon subunit [Streptomyces pinistramenti]|uniref:acyl-CoA carboxylase epsilon subunit n=1 Tax=Streptomyces pinistramenti TaxID=2884812 RepID=UPI001D062210|nr:acyl-CoA carboxylase epsilon subunit [Streptomyces pinistramenti]MCB5910692.1 acyl-CoA carboxylase subunit epsilon [Streptomyces pinistramenti]
MTAPADSAPHDFALRIDRGVAEPEELAAITVILWARLARSIVGVEDERPARHHADHVDRAHRVHRHPHPHLACWAGCWACG